jgi:hypothetical protein
MDTIVKYKWAILACVGLIFLILTHMSQLLHIDKEYFSLIEDIGHKFSDEIWIAVFISIIIAFVLEKAAHDKVNNIITTALRDEVTIMDKILQRVLSDNNRILKDTEKSIERSQESVLIAAFRKSIPRNVFDAVNRMVFARKFYRNNTQSTWRFRLDEISGEPRLIVHVSISYALINLTGTDEEYKIRHEIERSSIPPGGRPITLIQVNGEKQNLDSLKPLQAEKDNDIVCYELNAPIKVPGRGHINVRREFEFVRKLEDRDIWYTLYAADGMVLNIFDPDDCVRVDGEFRVAPIGDIRFIVTHSATSVTTEVLETVLPYQGLMFSWKYQTKSRVKPSSS